MSCITTNGRRLVIRRLPFVIAACVTADVCQAEEQARFRHEARLPGQVLASLTIHDATASAERIRDSHQRQFGGLCDRFLAGLDARRDDISSQLQNDIGINFEEFCELELGQITFASVKVPDQTLALVALVDFQQQVLMERLVGRLNEAVLSVNFERSDMTVGETTIAVYRREQPRRELAVCVYDHVLCLATNAAVMEQMLAGWNARPGGSMPAPAYAAVRENCHSNNRDPLLTWFADPVSLWQEVTFAEEPDDTEFPQFFLSLIPRLGLDRLKGLGGTFDVDAEDFATVARLQVVMDEPRSGLLNMLRFQSGDLRPPTWMLQETPSYLALHWDLDRFFEGVGQVLSILEGEGALNEYLRRISLLRGGLNLKRDVADRLTGRLTLTCPVIDGKQRWLISLQVRDPQEIAKLLRAGDSDAVAPGASGVADKNGSVNIWRRHEFGTDLNLALIGDLLLITDSEPCLQQTLAAADNPDHIQVRLERAATCFPEKCLMQWYQATDPLSRTVHEYLRTETTVEKTLGVDFSLLPAFDDIQHCIGPSAASAVENSAGVLFTHFSLYKAASDPVTAR